MSLVRSCRSVWAGGEAHHDSRPDAGAIGMLGVMYFEGKDVTPSYRRARELHQRAIELGSSSAEGSLQHVIESIENVS